MDPTCNDHQPLEQLESIDDLLEDFWFFDNLLDRRSRILRYCHSDPYPFSPFSSSSLKPEFPIGNSDSEKKVLEASAGVPAPCKEDGGKKINKMRRQLSEKIQVQERRGYLEKKEPLVRAKGVIKEGSRRSRTCTTSINNNKSIQSFPMGGGLQRTQTLPSYIGREGDGNEFRDQESDDSRMGFLIREAIASSSSSSGFTPSKQNISKLSSIPRHRPPRSSRPEETIEEMVVKSQRRLKESDSESEKKKKQEREEEEQRRVPRAAVKSRSAGVVGQPIPVWVPKESRRDMKAQIKFWARTVASNVRQEC